MFMSFKLMFFLFLIIGTLITVSAHSLIGMWMGLEINLLSLIPLLIEKNNNESTEASIKYFITQVMASNIFLMSIILLISHKETLSPVDPMIFLQTAIFIKMGAAPLHAWFPEVMKGLSWTNCLIMLTWQKIAPMIILLVSFKPSLFMNFIILSSALIGGILGINQTSLKKIMAYSSINHISWMICTMMSKSLWTTYFMIYSAISANIIVIIQKMKISYINEMPKMFQNKSISNIMFSMNFFSLGGVPPFLGFLPKWLVIQTLVEKSQILIVMALVITTLIPMFYYLRLTLTSLSLSINQKIYSKMDSNKLNMWILSSNIWVIASLIFGSVLLNF